MCIEYTVLNTLSRCRTHPEVLGINRYASAWGRTHVSGRVALLRLPSQVYNDSQGALAQIVNPQSSHRSMHINLAHHICRERQAGGGLDFRYCSMNVNRADCLTKPLAGPALAQCLAGMGVA